MPLSSIAGMLVGPVTDLLDKVVADADERARLAHEIATLAARQSHEIQVEQIGVNKIEAANKSVFTSGWRPFIGWVCGAALAFNYIASPILGAIGLDLHPLDISMMMPVLLGLLGLGGLRTTEKIKGVAR